MLHVLVGPDDYTIAQTLKKIKQGIGDASLLEANTTVFEAEGLTAERLQADCAVVPFMTEKRLIIVNGLLLRFHPKERSAAAAAAASPTPGTTRRAAIKRKEDGFEAFAGVIKSLPATTILVLIDTDIRDRDIKETKRLKELNPLFREIEPICGLTAAVPLPNDQLKMWIQVKIQDLGGAISPQAVNSLTRLVGSNLWIMSNELAKLCLFASGRRIEEKDVTQLVANARESNIFNLIDAVFDGKVDIAESILQELLDAGEPPAQVLFMIVRQMQLITRLKGMKTSGHPKMEMQSRLGLMQEFAWIKTAAQAERFTFPQIKKVYNRLLEADLAIKTGKMDGDTVLSVLIAELASEVALSK